MTKARRKKTITIETIQRTVIYQNSNQPSKIWCEFCQTEVKMTVPNIAATILGTTEREIYRRVEQGNLHFIETETGEIFICLNLFMTKQRGDE